MAFGAEDEAGWRPDPLGTGGFRWWDGRSWTDEVWDAPASDIDVSGTPIAPPPHSRSGEPARRAQTFEEAVAGVPTSADWLSEQVDWSRLAIRLHRADELGGDIIEVRAGTLPPLVIDLFDHVYWWELDVADLPPRVESLSITEHGRTMPVVTGTPRDVDPLFWRIGLHAFEGGLATWMPRTDRYQLRQWPNLTALPHQPQHLRAISLLSQTALAPGDLADASGLGAAESNRLLTIFSLMGLLLVLPGQDAPRLVLAAPKPGLFGRLMSMFRG